MLNIIGKITLKNKHYWEHHPEKINIIRNITLKKDIIGKITQKSHIHIPNVKIIKVKKRRNVSILNVFQYCLLALIFFLQYSSISPARMNIYFQGYSIDYWFYLEYLSISLARMPRILFGGAGGRT